MNYGNPVNCRFVWHELMTSDPQAAGAFYSKVVGWGLQSWDKDPSYNLFTLNDNPMAGFLKLPDSAAEEFPYWISYIDVPEIDDTIVRVTRLRGKVLKRPVTIPEVGRFAVMQDPQGAVFGVITPEQGPWSYGEPKPGDFSWHELQTTDWRSAMDFYQGVFGWERARSMEVGDLGVYQSFGWEGETLGGMFNRPKGMEGPPFWVPYILVSDAKKAAEAVEKFDGTTLSGPTRVPEGSWILQGLDPQGAIFAVQSKPEGAKGSDKPKAKASKPAPKKTAVKNVKKKAAPPKKGKPAGKRAPKKASTPKKKAAAPAKKKTRGGKKR